MTEVLLPPWIIPEKETHEWLDEGSSMFRAAFAPGLAQRQSFGGLRLKLSRQHTVRGEEKAQLLSILKATRGSYNALRTKVHFALRGSGLGSELLSNNTFASGTTGFTAVDATATIAVQDRILRSTCAQGSNTPFIYQQVTGLTQYASYAARAFMNTGRGSPWSPWIGIGEVAGGVAYGQSGSTSGQNFSGGILRTVAGVVRATDAYFGAGANSSEQGRMASDYLDFLYTSYIRCPLIDNGSNMLLRSDEFDHASWVKTRSTVSADAAVSPDGNSTADALVEDSTASSTHEVGQTATVAAAAAEYSFSVALKANTRTWARVYLREATGATDVATYINLSTGALGTAATGANWSNARFVVTNIGNGFFRLSVTARKTNAATTISANIQLATGDGGNSYTGNGTSSIYAWRGTLAQSSVPTRLVQTTSAASTGTSQTGNALYLKGATASASGLLLPADWFEVNGELKQASAALNTDAAGLGYLQFEPALIRSPADNDPVIVVDPMGKFLVSNIKIENRFGTDAIVTYDLEHIYE